LLSYPYFKDVW